MKKLKDRRRIEEGKKLLKMADLNKLAFAELVLSIDVRSSGRKIAFHMVKDCKNKDYVEGNTWYTLTYESKR